MEDTKPCPFCDTGQMYLERKIENLSILGGAVVGAVVGFKSAKSLGPLPAVAAVTIGGVAGALSGVYTGSILGKEFGRKFDETIICKYKCNSCSQILTS